MSDRLNRLVGNLRAHDAERQRASQSWMGLKKRLLAEAEATGHMLAEAAADEWTRRFTEVRSFLEDLAPAGVVDRAGGPVKFGYGYFSRRFCFRIEKRDAETCDTQWSSLNHESSAAALSVEQVAALAKAIGQREMIFDGEGLASIAGRTVRTEEAASQAAGILIRERFASDARTYRGLRRVLGQQAWDHSIDAIRQEVGRDFAFDWDRDYGRGEATLLFWAGPMLVVRAGHSTLEIHRKSLITQADEPMHDIEKFLRTYATITNTVARS